MIQNNFRYRTAKKGDLPQIIKLLLEDAKQHYYEIKNQALVQKSLTMVLDEQKYGVFFVLEDLDNGKVFATTHFVQIFKGIGSGSNIFVDKNYRNKGIFLYIWDRLIQYSRKSGITFLIGYTLQQVQQKYVKMGYTMNDELRYGFSFSFPMKKKETLTKEMLLQPISQFSIIEAEGPGLSPSEVIDLKPILKKKPSFNGFNLTCFKGDELVGYCEFYPILFLYFCSLRYFVKVFYAKEGLEHEVCQALVKFVYQRHELNFSEIYFVKQDRSDSLIEKYFPEGQDFNHFVGMQKTLDPQAKL